uniref:RNA helicase n=2 Tax=Chrysotila carterae TaxID=13221 RepID=A0A7S4B8L6_CHRCT
MLDLGFEKDVRSIISSTPSSRRTAMFTATWPDSVRALAEEFLANPIRVNVGSESLSANHRVTQHVEVLDQQQKEGRLVDLLTKYKPSMNNRVLVFALYKKEAARVEQTLQRRGFDCIAIHGDQTQAVRSASLQSFKEGKVPLLVATDVAARGLDIPLVQVVINFTFPLTIEDYVHRIGRTGRGGKTGIAHTFFTNFDKAHAGALQNILREANQDVPNDLLRFGSAVKKKEHKMYGSFGPADGAPMKAATRIVFD